MRRCTSSYAPEVNVSNFSSSWKDGLAFCALLHHYHPELVNWEKVEKELFLFNSNPLKLVHSSARERLRFAFDGFEREFGIAKLLDPEDVCDVDSPDERSLITYVSQLHNRLVDEPKVFAHAIPAHMHLQKKLFNFLFANSCLSHAAARISPNLRLPRRDFRIDLALPKGMCAV